MNIGIYTDLDQMQFPGRYQYVIQSINDHPLLPEDVHFYTTADQSKAKIIYGRETEFDKLTIHKSEYLFNQKFIHNFICGKHPLEERSYYSIGPEKNDHPIDRHKIPFDLFESIFFHLSRIEEIHFPLENFLGKKEAYDQKFLVIQNKIQQIPIVDHLIELLLKLSTDTAVQMPTTFTLSHDIDAIRKFKSKADIFRKTAGQILHRNNAYGIPLLWKQMMHTPENDPYDTSSWMMTADGSFRKEIYFLCGGNHRWDTPYSLKDSVFLNFLNVARRENYQIGIHPSYLSWNDPERIKIEKQILEEAIHENITISRQHFLNFDVQQTPSLLMKAGIEKDSSIGFSRHIGFRAGTGFDYYLYDFEKEQASIRESPLAFMDVACLYEADWNINNYLNLKNAFLNKNKYNTHIGLLYHNTTFDEMEMRDQTLVPHYLKFINDER